MTNIALITGATAGIGEATAYILAQNGYDLILVGRRMERLTELCADLNQRFPTVKTLFISLDVCDSAAVNQMVNDLPDEWKQIQVLINNAGLAVGLDSIQEGNIEDWDRMIDTNVKGLLYVSRAVIPLLIERGGGHIVNLGSIAGKEVYLKGNVYCATKFAVDALTKAMRIDLLPHRIRVTSINPGAVETDFSTVRFKGDSERAAQVYANYEPLTAADIAEVIWFALSRPPHVCLNDVVLTPLAQANAFYWHKDA